MDKKTNHGGNQIDMKESGGRKNHYIRRDITKQNERTESTQGIGEER